MSSTTIYKLFKDSEPEELATFRNSWGSAPIVWDALSKKAGVESYFLIDDGGLGELKNSPLLSLLDKTMLFLTFQPVYVAYENRQRLSPIIDEWATQYPTANNRVNHWRSIARVVSESPKCDGFYFHWTSVDGDMWVQEIDEETEEYVSTDWVAIGNELFDLVAELESVND